MIDPYEVVMARDGRVYLGRRGKAEGDPLGRWRRTAFALGTGWRGSLADVLYLEHTTSTKAALRDWFMTQTSVQRRTLNARLGQE